MPFYFCFDETRQCLLIRGAGHVTDEDFAGAMETTLDKSQISRDVLRVWDVRGIEKLVFTPEVLTKYRTIVKERRQDMGDSIVVVVERELIRTVTKLLTAISGQEYKFVEHLQEADDWLEFEPGTLESVAETHQWTEV